MGYICPNCGEGLPTDETCPCTIGPKEEDEEFLQGGPDDMWTPIYGPLTAEVANPGSPLRRFLNDRFTSGLRSVQRSYREAAPPLAVPGVSQAEANPGTVGTAADWLLRFLVHPRPPLHLAAAGAAKLAAVGSRHGAGLLAALHELADSLGAPDVRDAGEDERVFTGPQPGNDADAEYLARACWALALLTEIHRGGLRVATLGPLGQFQDRQPSAAELVAIAPPAALHQLASFRQVFETTLLPNLAARQGQWMLGPTFTGSALIKADADLIAVGLLLDLKTTKKLTLAVEDVLQLIGYALLDFDDDYKLNELGIFNARHAYLTTWNIHAILAELAGHPVDVQAVRRDFRKLLLTHRPKTRQD